MLEHSLKTKRGHPEMPWKLRRAYNPCLLLGGSLKPQGYLNNSLVGTFFGSL